ncbi:MAG: substrate-binding domain-containing protein [Acidimicrobiia bacterium]|nr:substrate-binding domain-containing protein [Acidimicrobiia bacterium]
MRKQGATRWRYVGLLLLFGLVAAACTPSDPAPPKIGLLLPELATARYETQDRPAFEARVAELCPECRVTSLNADNDPLTQMSQAEQLIAAGIDVLVLDPVNSAEAAPMVEMAKAEGIPVISYDRLVADANLDYFVSFDGVVVGQLQAEELLTQMASIGAATGNIVMVNGSPDDNNAVLFNRGAHLVLDTAPVGIVEEFWVPGWGPDDARKLFADVIDEIGPDGFDAVYVANDGMAGGIIAALEEAGIDPTTVPITGQDAELAAIQRLLDGTQSMTVYKALADEAAKAAELAVILARGEAPDPGFVVNKVNNDFKDVDGVLLTPVAVTIDTIAETVVADGFWSIEEICAGEYQSLCAAAGLQ